MALAERMYGTDSGNEFKITNLRDVEVQVEYDNGDRAWFMKSRFQFEGGVLKLN
jgi:hypothetical protein